jgi:anaerobic selenocysteine-containing dehydrogenase
MHDKQVSRRRFLHLGAAAGGGAVFGLGSIGPASAATAKVPKQTVNYQAAPKGQSRCGTCSFFQSPSSCNYVDGPISPSGWCMLYQPKK